MTRQPENPPPDSDVVQVTWDERLMRFAWAHRREVAGGGLVLLSGVTLMGLLGLTAAGPLNAWVGLLRQLFGWGSLALSAVVLFVGLTMLLPSLHRRWRLRPSQAIGLELLILTFLPLAHQLSGATLDTALTGRTIGGLYGWALTVPLHEWLGPLLTFFFYLILFIVGLVLVTQFKLQSLIRALVFLSGRLRRWADAIDVDLDAWEFEEAPAGNPVTEPVLIAPVVRPAQPALPSLRLLHAGRQVSADDAEITHKRAIIERTLTDFGLSGAVVEVRRGPTITQFGVEPGYLERPGPDGEIFQQKVRISQIASLRADFALALAVKRLRIEAPVPGRGIVGIEVPNAEAATVRLRDVLESAEFRRIQQPLAVALGKNVSGKPMAIDIAKMPHLLIAGTTGSGKSIAIKSMIASLLMFNTPEQLKLVLIDPKRVEMLQFSQLPHVLGNVEVEAERIVGVLRWVVFEMERRYELFAAARARNLAAYNAGSAEPMSRIVVFIDELADLMVQYSSEVERHLCRLAQMARATGIHLVVATQRPSVDVITGLIKANFPARIAFNVASGTDSRVILDTIGAENLLGQGDMLFLAPDASVPERIQGCYVDDTEIGRIGAHWAQVMPAAEPAPAPWTDLLAKMRVIEETDELLEAAVKLCQQHDSVSTSLLQRRLRVGFPRAARIMESLYDLGLVEDPKSGGKTRGTHISPEDGDPMDEVLKRIDEE